MISYYPDSLKSINDIYLDSSNVLYVNFTAKLDGGNTEKTYQVKVKLNDKKGHQIVSIKGERIKFDYDSLLSNKYVGVIYLKTPRNNVKNKLDSCINCQVILKDKFTGLCIEKYKNEYRLKKGFYYVDYIEFQYYPNWQQNNCFYIIRINQRKKWDKRFLLPVTIPLDIITLPIQIIVLPIILLTKN